MKAISVRLIKSQHTSSVLDCFVDKGYLQGASGSMPDCDIDYQADRRQDVKKYTEDRYNHDGKQRVFSAGTLTTLKAKAVLKDVARTMRIPVSLVNYMTAIIDDDKCDYTGLFKLAASEKKMAKFIADYPQLFEDIRTLMFQPRSSSVHASALLITPDTKDGEEMECFDFTPIKKVDGILVSEFDGYQLDECGLLKNDCLATKELSKLHDTFDLIERHYNKCITLESIVTGDMNDPKVYDALSKGYTQNVFQFSSRGMTKFLMDLRPTCIDDLIAANALYRPATMGNLEEYANCKNGLVAPVYLWGTYNSLKNTFGLVVYQEQIVSMAREVGGFSLGDGVKLVKFVSKKKTDKIKAMQSKFMEGAAKNGCPKEDAEKIWGQIEVAGSYCFNKCISGRESIRRTNKTTSSLTIAEMYKTMNDAAWAKAHGHAALRERYLRLGYGKGWSLAHAEGQDFLLKNEIKDIRYMGIRPVYRITLEGGYTIDVTENHKHPTNHGQKRTDELIVGVDQMYISEENESVELATVQSVEYLCDEDVYDVEMADPNHTFTTVGGVVTCNSHATAYAATAYAGGWLKANYPVAFYTVALQWADDDEIVSIMGEMEAFSNAKVVAPDINVSEDKFYTDYETNSIFWSLSRIKMLGVKAVDWIMTERRKNGNFTSIENFIDRVFKYKLKKYQYWDDPDNEDEVQKCPVNARHIRNLIFAGCFDKIENAHSVVERFAIMRKAAERLGFEITEKDCPTEMRDKHYWWSQQQITVSGMGSIDYKRIYDNSQAKLEIKGRASYATLRDIAPLEVEDKRVGICATVVEFEEKSYIDKKTGDKKIYGKMVLQQNNDTCECLVWPDEYAEMRGKLLECKDKLIICSAVVKYSDYQGKNCLQFYRRSVLEIL